MDEPDRDTPPAVVVGEVEFRASGSCGQHADGGGRVHAGAGFWSGDPHEDLCTWCWEVVREDPMRQPDSHELQRLARAGILDDVPCFVDLRHDSIADDLARLAELVTAGELPRIAVQQTPLLGDWLEDGGVLPEGTIVRRDGVSMRLGSMHLQVLELYLAGGGGVPPLDPDLVARIEAAKDERGVIHDPALADEYFAALQAQGEDMRAKRGWAEPVIEDGRAFPSAPEDEPPLG